MALFPLQVKNLAIFVACLNLITASGVGTKESIVMLALVLLAFAPPVLRSPASTPPPLRGPRRCSEP